MLKLLPLTLLLALIMGCQGFLEQADSDPSIVGVRCFWIAPDKPFNPNNLRYIERNADAGNTLCKIALGKMYQEGGYGVDQDFDRARALFTESAQADPAANVLLGQMAARGEGEPVDFVKARKFYALSGKNGVISLGQLMESGKGGSQDLSGALALYLNTVEKYGDEYWVQMDRLRKQGQRLSEVQGKRYQQLWNSGFHREQARRLAIREVYEAVNATGEVKDVTLAFLFTSGSDVPQISMTQGSGDANVDEWVMRAAALIRMADVTPMADSAGELKIQSPIILKPHDTQYMNGICGRYACR